MQFQAGKSFRDDSDYPLYLIDEKAKLYIGEGTGPKKTRWEGI